MTERDHLAELEKRGDDLEVFLNCEAQAREWIAQHGTQALVDELRAAAKQHRRMKLGTSNTLILLAHVDALEAAAVSRPAHTEQETGADAS